MSRPSVHTTISAIRAWSRTERAEGQEVVLVPTMGALHDGHIQLVRQAEREGRSVCVSIFVNPTQFGPNEDFDAYPRTLEADLDRLAETDCDAVFAPTPADMYPAGTNLAWVDVETMGDRLCGAARPGHFRGVTTIVSRLFVAAEPDVAVFGLKDAQQFLILSRMTKEMGFGVRLEGVPTVRESDGLAMSSRNRYLTTEERTSAPVLHRALRSGRERIVTDGWRDAHRIVAEVKQTIESEPVGRIDYVELVDAELLQPVERLQPGDSVLLAGAVFYGQARLIDNEMFTVPEDESPA